MTDQPAAPLKGPSITSSEYAALVATFGAITLDPANGPWYVAALGAYCATVIARKWGSGVAS